jgi:hypothetical protein
MALTNYVLMPGADYQAACDAIRAKTGKSELIKSGELASEISGITGGGSGGSVEGVHTVTFMSEDGSAVLYERLVVDGDDCADVVDRGLLATPTKASTAQYNYTHSGWSLTSGGSASASALKSVTADRTVYAAFASTVRYYTITYYDGDTVLKTESLPYGAMPSYTPEKDGYGFDGWEPELSMVTGDASYYSRWTENITFANASWSKIAEISESGEAENYFSLGETKELSFDVDGVRETLTMEIIGFNHNDLADGTGKAGITLWSRQVLKTSMVPGKQSDANKFTGYDTSVIKTWFNGTLLDAMPETLRERIKEVYTPTSWAAGGTIGYGIAQESSNKCWLLSCTEMGASAYNGSSLCGVEGENYPLLTSDTSRIRYNQSTGEAVLHTTRSVLNSISSGAARLVCVNKSGGAPYLAGTHGKYDSAPPNNNYAIAFCI